MIQRFCVGAYIQNKSGEILFCRQPDNRGVYPGEWGVPGGGVEPNETLAQAVQREVQEEVGLLVDTIVPLFFWDDTRLKIKPGHDTVEVYMVYLIHMAHAVSDQVVLSEEFDEYVWLKPQDALKISLNAPTRQAVTKILEMTGPNLV